MLRPGQGVWIRMALITALAYGGSFVVRGVTAALRDAAAVVHLEVRAAAQGQGGGGGGRISVADIVR